MVSVIIPTYNREKTIERSIRSVLNQTVSDIEVIVVDDGSTDNTKSVVEKIKDERVRYVYQENSGACVARNKGILLSIGEYIAFQDSDDSWHSNKLEVQLLDLKKFNADVCFCKFIKHGYPEVEGIVSPNIPHGNIDYQCLIKNSVVSTQTILAKRTVFEANKFDSGIKRLQDYDWVIRAGKKCSFCLCEKALVDLYLQDDSITNKTKYLDALKKLLIKYEGSNYTEVVPILINKISNIRTVNGERVFKSYFKAYKLSHKFEYLVKAVLSAVGILPIILKHR